MEKYVKQGKVEKSRTPGKLRWRGKTLAFIWKSNPAKISACVLLFSLFSSTIRVTVF